MNGINNGMNNNMLNSNQMQQQMIQQQEMMQQRMAQQQIMQQQMMQQQIMQQQMMQQMELAERLSQVEVIFYQGIHRNGPQIKVQCLLNDKVSSMIEKYRNLSGDRNPSKKFIFNARKLNESLTLAEAGITDKSNVFVV